MNKQAIIDQMTLEEKAAFITGQDFWHTRALPRLGIPAIEMTDGPHGVRKMQDMAGENTFANPVPTTAFPTAALSACSFDQSLLQDMGLALASECRQLAVDLLLGPGANIKRSPLCGRNFEYFSEDPLLSGAMAGAWIEGLQAGSVGASLKHFAVNNQEKRRMSIDAVVEPRALHEIYLASFEEAVKVGHPSSIMCAYNKVNGELCSEHYYLNTTILRKVWGFGGFVVTDWGATRNRLRGLEAGIDLAMPATGPAVQAAIVKAVRAGQLAEAALDTSISRLLDFILSLPEKNAPADAVSLNAIHHSLALRIAEESSILIKNDQDCLPLDPAKPVCVIGSLAERPRYQGAGSSFLAPANVSSFISAVRDMGINCAYAAGYHCDTDQPDPELEAAALMLASQAAAASQTIIYYLGLPDAYESEGYDRQHLKLPPNQTSLLTKLAAILTATGAKLVAVFVGGSPVETDWLDSVQALLLGYLGGQASGEAQARLLFGLANPCGKLAESWPLKLEDNPSFGNYPGSDSQVFYKEGIFVGYRYYISSKLPVRFLFGDGLSYTKFCYDTLELLTGRTADAPDKATPAAAQQNLISAAKLLAGNVRVRISLTNSGARDGKEIVQIYASLPDSGLERPALALAGFAKILLKAGESASVEIPLSPLAVRYWDETTQDFAIENGSLRLLAGPSSANLPLSLDMMVTDGPDLPATLARLPRRKLQLPPASMSDSDFAQHFGGSLPLPPPRRPFSADSAFGDMASDSLIVKLVLKAITGQFLKGLGAAKDSPNYRMVVEMIKDMPLSRLESLSRGRFHGGIIKGLVTIANGKTLVGLWYLLFALAKGR